VVNAILKNQPLIIASFQTAKVLGLRLNNSLESMSVVIDLKK